MQNLTVTAVFAAFLIFICAASSALGQSDNELQKKELHITPDTNAYKKQQTRISELRFEGLNDNSPDVQVEEQKLFHESDVKLVLRQEGIKFFENDLYNPIAVKKAVKILKKWFVDLGYLNAQVAAIESEDSNNNKIIVFSINKNLKVLVKEIVFTGNKNFSNQELVDILKQCLGDDAQFFDSFRYEYCVRKAVFSHLMSKGFLQVKYNEPVLRQDLAKPTVVIDLTEGKRFRLGKIEIKDAELLSAEQIVEMLGQKEGDILDGKAFRIFFQDTLESFYANNGYIQYSAEIEPVYMNNLTEGEDGIANVVVYIDEGRVFKIAKIKFTGVEQETARNLNQLLNIKSGEIFNKAEFKRKIAQINDLNQFQLIDSEKDVDMLVDDEGSFLSIVIKIKKFS